MTKTRIIHWGWWRKRISFSLGISPPRYTLHLWPFTRKHSPLEFISSSAPWEKTCCTLNGPLHLDLNLPGNNFSLELNKRTRSPTLNSFLRIWASCHCFVFSLKSLVFSYAWNQNSSNSFSYNKRLSPAAFMSKFSALMAQ